MKGHNFDTNGFFFLLKAAGTLALIFAFSQLITSTSSSLPLISHTYVASAQSMQSPLSLRDDIAPPLTSADAYLIADLETQEILFGKNVDKERPIASLTKLMTAIVASEILSPEEQITVSQRAVATEGWRGSLRAGDVMSLNSLLRPLLLESSNDAAEAVAEYVGRDLFRDHMNAKARALGMEETVFEDPSGLSEKNTSTARELLLLTRYIYTNQDDIFNTTQLKTADVFLEDTLEYRHYVNNNPLVSHPDFSGGKNGYTDEARKTLITVFNLKYNNTTRPVAIIVLGSENHDGETRALYSWVQENIEN